MGVGCFEAFESFDLCFPAGDRASRVYGDGVEGTGAKCRVIGSMFEDEMGRFHRVHVDDIDCFAFGGVFLSDENFKSFP